MKTFFTLLVFVPTLFAANPYWVSPTGAAASWAACQSAAPLSGTAACSRSRANTSAVAGNMVYLRGGTYLLSSAFSIGLEPFNSGTAGNPITFSSAPGEEAIFEGGRCSECGWGLVLDKGVGTAGVGVGTYLRITGITFHNVARWAQLSHYASYNEIDHNTFYSDDGLWTVAAFKISSSCGGATGTCYSVHNWVHDNYFSRAKWGSGTAGACSEGSDLFVIGDGSPLPGDQYRNNYNTVERNYLEYAGHTTFDSYGNFTVFVNNVSHNEPWFTESQAGCTFPNDEYTDLSYRGKYGHRVFQMSTQNPDATVDGNYNLIEGSRFGFGSPNAANDGADSLDLAARRVIVRYNNIYGAFNSGLMFKYGYSQAGHPGTNNRVYNNTIYGNGKGNPFYETCTLSTCPEPLYGIRLYYSTLSKDNVMKNNIVYGSRRYELGGTDIQASSVNTVTNNWLTSDGNPLFVNPDMTDPTSQDLISTAHGYTATPIPNFALQGASPAIDGGTYLTQAVGAGVSSTTLVVDDAMYFQDGTWGSDLARGVTFFPDWIAIGTVGNTVRISAIDYATNTITLASSKSWANGAPIWLYKKSDGAVVLRGPAPDYGASESVTNSRTRGAVVGVIYR